MLFCNARPPQSRASNSRRQTPLRLVESRRPSPHRTPIVSFRLADLEDAPVGTRVELETLLPALRWNDDGLVPAIARDIESGDVLMLAWMNETALRETLTTRRVCYWSRSRQALWRKGETSGNAQELVRARLDCDGDTVLLDVRQHGPACHTGRRDCFYLALDTDGAELVSEPLVDPETLYGAS